MMDIHKARRINCTFPGTNTNTRISLKKSLRLPLAFPHNGVVNKSAFTSRLTSAESNAFSRPKHTPQKRLHKNIVNGIRRNRHASKGPTSRAGHNTRIHQANPYEYPAFVPLPSLLVPWAE